MYSWSKRCIKLVKLKMKINTKILKELTIIRTLFAVGLLVLLPGIIDNAAILALAQDSKTIQISIVSDASRLTDTAYQPNPISIKVGDTIEWTNNDDTSPHTVTKKSTSTSNYDDSDDKSDSEIVEKIEDEFISNIIVNIKNNMGGDRGDDHRQHNHSSQGNSLILGQFDSGIIQTVQTFRYTFNDPGTFEYYCTLHPSMVGKIVVS
jgi:plastocyanin